MRPTPATINPLHVLLWGPTNSLAAWATAAGTAVIDSLAPGAERACYRHDLIRDADGVVLHQLAELDSGPPLFLAYERSDGARIPAFCRPWPAFLSRFVTAILHRDLLAPTAPTGDAAILEFRRF
jgi:hypothetical protein